MRKNCIIENVWFLYVQTLTRFKQFTGMLKFTFIENGVKNNILLLIIYFFKVCSARTSPTKVAIVYATENIQVI